MSNLLADFPTHHKLIDALDDACQTYPVHVRAHDTHGTTQIDSDDEEESVVTFRAKLKFNMLKVYSETQFTYYPSDPEEGEDDYGEPNDPACVSLLVWLWFPSEGDKRQHPPGIKTAVSLSWEAVCPDPATICKKLLEAAQAKATELATDRRPVKFQAHEILNLLTNNAGAVRAIFGMIQHQRLASWVGDKITYSALVTEEEIPTINAAFRALEDKAAAQLGVKILRPEEEVADTAPTPPDDPSTIKPE